MSSPAALYLENVVADVSLEARTIRKDNKPTTQYYLAYKKSGNNLTVNIGDYDKIDEGNVCVLLTEPSHYQGKVQGAPSALVGIPEPTAQALDELRVKLRDGCLKHRVLGAMTHEALFDLNASESMLDNIVRRRDDSSNAALSLKFPDDAKYYKIRVDSDGTPELVLLRDNDQIREVMRPGARFITSVSFASLYKQQTCGCARYVRWAAFFDSESSQTAEPENMLCLGSATTSVAVKQEAEAEAEAEATGNEVPVAWLTLEEYEGEQVFGGDEVGAAFKTSGEKRSREPSEDVDELVESPHASKRTKAM